MPYTQVEQDFIKHFQILWDMSCWQANTDVLNKLDSFRLSSTLTTSLWSYPTSVFTSQKRLTSQQTWTFGDPAISISNITKFSVYSERRTQWRSVYRYVKLLHKKKKVEKRHCLLLPLQSAQNRAVHPILFPLTPTNLLARQIPNLVTSGLEAAILEVLRGWDNGDSEVDVDHLRNWEEGPAWLE